MIIIRMPKLYEKSIRKPLTIIVQYRLTQDIFPSEWKKANAYDFTKKRQTLS